MVSNIECNRIGIICDMHLPEDTSSPQYYFLQEALNQMYEDGTKYVFCLGDITRFGEKKAWATYMELVKKFEHYELIGNSDVRDADTRTFFENEAKAIDCKISNRRIIGVNSPDGVISKRDRERLSQLQPQDIIVMHHYVEALAEESKQWLENFINKVSVVIIHGHRHRTEDRYIGQTRVIGLKGLDPDKAIGDFPAFAYADIKDEGIAIREYPIKIQHGVLEDLQNYFGISCVDNARDVTYAIENNVKHIELRCNGNWEPDYFLLPLIQEWRTKTSGYLSVHMPNLYYKEGAYVGVEQWNEAIRYALAVKADGFTMHPPRVSIADMIPDSEVWNSFLTYYLQVVNSVSDTVKLGIENLHKLKRENLDENRGFGYTPEEVSSWIDALNAQIGYTRVGHVLDVGHTRNNGVYAQMYPVSHWYQQMGGKTVAYHIHQVVQEDGGLGNHRPIENWFGPMINYTSFFYAWQHNVLNHVPVFLEVRGYENYEKSMQAFKSLL